MKPLRYLSVFSGIEAASVAWEPLGFKAVGFSEIEPFQCEVLRQRFPNIPNYGDIKKQSEWPVEPGTVDILVGGSPCQAFSVAGLRKGLADPRGHLSLTFLSLADRIRPRWIVWENVFGVLSSNGGRDLGSFLGALGQLGYGWAYRVIDARHLGVPQRRRRIYLVACVDGDFKRAAEVLSLCEVGDGDTGEVDPQGGCAADLAAPIAAFRKSRRAQSVNDKESWVESDYCNTLNCFDTGDIRTTHIIVNKEDGLPRRLTPLEVERLQGFPDNWTRIPWDGMTEEQCPDIPRFKSVGNSMAVPVMRWIGQNISKHHE